MNALSQGLIVPLNVLAFAVNEKDAHDATPYFSGANSVFTDQLGPNQAFLGANVNRSLLGTPAQALEAGIHLHWALPDALTKASSASGNLAFMPVPNRWLVHRLVITGKQAIRTSWVVLSDKLNDTLPAGQASITLPTYTTASGQNYQYCGERQRFDQHWAEPDIPSNRTFTALAGMEISAVASGQAVFASFYPNCRGVFGFTDDLSDLDLPPNSAIELMYVVSGWYSNHNNDPLNGGQTLEQIQKEFSWTFDDSNANAAPSYSLYHGSVQNVLWHPDQTYLPDYSVDPQEIDLDISLGNNPSETLSSYLQNKIKPTLPYFQILLNGYLQGLLSKLKNPAPNQLATLKEELQENEFQAIKAEYIYTIMKKVTTYDTDNQPVVRYVQAGSLPPRIGDALNLLNFYAQSVQLLQESLANFQWQLFADWYRIFMAVASQQQTSYNIAYQKYNDLSNQTQQLGNAANTLNLHVATVNAQLPPDCELQQVPAARYWQANDLVFLLSGEALPSATRYGDDGRLNQQGNLLCRLENQPITSASANQITLNAANFTTETIPTPNALPAPAVFNHLLVESLLLNASVLSNVTGITIGFQDIKDALHGQSSVLSFVGGSPSFISLSKWQENPWVPLFAHWQIEFQPIFPTTDCSNTQIIHYPTDYFTRQFTINQNDGAAIGFTSASNPASNLFNQSYQGVSVLSTSAIKGFIKQLGQSDDPVLQECLQAIEQQNMVMQSLSGLNAAFLMHSQELQLNIAVPSDSEYAPLTQFIATAVGGYASSAPNFNSFYNPIRSGFLTVDLTLIDIFGQKKTVKPTTINIAQSLQLDYQDQTIPNIAYLQPRLSQATRLLFRFLAADTSTLEEMNLHPATTPICGWLLPNHLNGSLFIYDVQGASLGSLFLNGDNTKILWQSAPGNDQTIDLDVQAVMEDQQPQLRDLVISLSQAKPQYFSDFMQAIDAVNGFVEPQEYSTNNDLPVLIGRPLAIVQTAMVLELQGTPQYNQSWNVLNLDPQAYPLAETDNGFTKVDFPVVLGKLQQLNDGLIGYYKFGQNNYDWANFYTMGANASNTSGVKIPDQNTITLNPHPGVDGTTLADAAQKLLLLIDPRAAIHATTGILPTKAIRIPSDMYTDTLRTLEMIFLTTPILAGNSALNLPLPNETGYQWSWIQEKLINNTPEWKTTADINNTMPNGVWTYTPQTLLEGWLRLNPELLSFEVFNASQKAIVKCGNNTHLILQISNKQGRPITFLPATPVPESQAKNGSVFYIHFGSAIPQDKVANILLQADGWQFSCMTDDQYGCYWAASPNQDFTLAGADHFQIGINNLEVSTDKQQIMIFFDYYQVTNLNDGVYQDVLGVTQQ